MHHSSFFVFSVRKIGARNLKYGKNTFMFGDYDDYMKAPKEGEEKIKDVLIYAEYDMETALSDKRGAFHSVIRHHHRSFRKADHTAVRYALLQDRAVFGGRVSLSRGQN